LGRKRIGEEEGGPLRTRDGRITGKEREALNFSERTCRPLYLTRRRNTLERRNVAWGGVKTREEEKKKRGGGFQIVTKRGENTLPGGPRELGDAPKNKNRTHTKKGLGSRRLIPGGDRYSYK